MNFIVLEYIFLSFILPRHTYLVFILYYQSLIYFCSPIDNPLVSPPVTAVYKSSIFSFKVWCSWKKEGNWNKTKVAILFLFLSWFFSFYPVSVLVLMKLILLHIGKCLCISSIHHFPVLIRIDLRLAYVLDVWVVLFDDLQLRKLSERCEWLSWASLKSWCSGSSSLFFL